MRTVIFNALTSLAVVAAVGEEGGTLLFCLANAQRLQSLLRRHAKRGDETNKEKALCSSPSIRICGVHRGSGAFLL